MEFKYKSKFKLFFLIFSILLIVFFAFLMHRCLPEEGGRNKNINSNNINNNSINNINNSSSFRESVFTLTNEIDYTKLVLKIEDKEIETEVVFSQKAKAQGLSNRETLETDKGMLFLMPEDANPFFVMREMNFPLDIVFINKAEVVKVFHQAEPEGITYRKNYTYGPADMVLELPGGYFLENNLKIGSRISIVK